MAVLFMLVISVLVCVYVYYKYVYLFNKKLKRFPCPPAVPILGHGLDFFSGKGHLEVLTDYVKTYGDIVRIKTSPKRQILLISDYHLLEFILSSSKILEKSVDYRNFSRWLGTGLLTGGGAKWKNHRMMITPTFHYKILENFVEVFESNGKTLIKQFEKELDKSSVEIHHFITLCALDTICETVMGTSVKAQENVESEYVRSVKEMCRIVVERAFSPHKMIDSIYFFTNDYKKETKALNILHSYTDEVINRRQSMRGTETKEKKKKVFLDLLLDVNVNGQCLTLDEIRQEVNTFMFAGHDTVASTISFTLFCLANHPEVQAKVMAEQTEIFDNNFERSVTLQDLKNMRYLELVIKETLRLYPPVPFVARELDEDVLYEDTVLPKGLTTTLFIYAIHRNPKFFPEPENFDPSRFETVDGKTPFAYLPFSAGPRNCIGQKFGMAEVKSVVSRVVRTFELLPSIPHHELKLAAEIVLISSNGFSGRIMFEECFGDGPFVFRLNESGTGPQLLTQVCLERGWREFNSESGDQWNLWWRTSGFPISHHRNLYAWQYINHIPKGSAICRKDNLVRYLRCMRKVYGSIYDFSPHGYNLPLEYTKLAAECSRNGRPFSSKSDQSNDKFFEEKPIWICKPVAQSQGRGIFLFRKLSELSYDSNTIVQRYIEKPLLIGGYKFDLRLYVCIPSYHPVTIYMYREGLARFGTDKFSLNDLRNPFRHLTNCSINKLGPGYSEMKDRIGSGCKWTLRQLRRYFQQAGISDWLLWQRISSLVILTVLSHVSQIPPTVNCFEFFGFDVLIDNTLRPWLLEVNLSPALSNDCDADRSVKKPMLHDMFDLLGLPLYNTGLSVFDIWLDESAINSAEEDVERTKSTFKNTLSVLNAAGRWRRKHRKMSARQISSRSSSAARTKFRAVSATTPKIVNLPKLNQNLPKNKPNYDKNFDEELKKVGGSKKWGNGRDWNFASSSEGSWIRIWPMTIEPPNKNGFNVKQMVTKVIKYTKTAKELAKNHPTASECQLNEFLQQEMEMSGEIWIPPV